MNQNPAPEANGTPERVKVRQEKHARFLTDGCRVYPVVFVITPAIVEICEKYLHLKAGDETQDEIDIVGYAMLARNGGKLCFVALMDGEGNRIQVMLPAAEVGFESLAQCKADVDLGDHLFAHGHVISSRRGEFFVLVCPDTAPTGLFTPGTGKGDSVSAWQIVARPVHPLLRAYTAEGGTEVFLSRNMRVQCCYLDVIVRPAACDMARMRPKVVKSPCDYFDEAGFIEIETPMLQNLHGGAAARPLPTYMNAYNTGLFLRIALEFLLERVVIGGIDKVFEINRNLRNEGVDSSHNPEFTMLEAYEVYGSYDTMVRCIREFVQKTAHDALDIELVTLPDGSLYDLSGSWAEISMLETTAGALGRKFNVDTPLEEPVKIVEELGEDAVDHWGPGKVVEVIFGTVADDKLWVPTFVRDYLEGSSPLTRGHHSKRGIIKKWDPHVRGFELATAYSELVDPVIQRQRFEAQALAAANGDPEAMVLDEGFLMAVECDTPPAGSMGMSLDRLLMALTGHEIRKTITLPFVREL